MRKYGFYCVIEESQFWVGYKNERAFFIDYYFSSGRDEAFRDGVMVDEHVERFILN